MLAESHLTRRLFADADPEVAQQMAAEAADNLRIPEIIGFQHPEQMRPPALR